MQLNITTSSGQTVVVQPGGSVLMGSDPSCDLVIAGAADRHALIRMNADSTLTLQDLGTPEGVVVNGQRISGAVSLRGDEQIQVGNSSIDLRVTVAPPAAAPPAETTAPLPAAVAPPAAAAAATPAAPATPPSAPPPTPPRSGLNVWMLVAAGVALVAVVVIAVLLLTGGSDDEQAEPSPAPIPSAEPSPEPSPEPSMEPSAVPVAGAQYEGLVNGSYRGKYGFRFKARCQQTGPCPVIGTSGAVYHFKYSPASHTYSAKATDRGQCKGTGPDFPYPIHRSITFRVLRSEETFGTWQATRLGFTMKSTWPEVSRTTGNTRYFCKAGSSKTSWVGSYIT